MILQKLKSSFGIYEKLIVACYFLYSGSAAAALFSNQKFGTGLILCCMDHAAKTKCLLALFLQFKLDSNKVIFVKLFDTLLYFHFWWGTTHLERILLKISISVQPYHCLLVFYSVSNIFNRRVKSWKSFEIMSNKCLY